MTQQKKTTTAAVTPIDTKKMDEAVQVGKQTVEQAVAATKEQVEKASTAALKGYDEFATINKTSMDAFVKSSNIMAKGFEDLGKAYFAFAQSAAEQNVAAAKKLMTAKTINDVVDIQSDIARTSFDAWVAESTKMSEMGMKVANEAFEPIQAQFTTVVEKMTKQVAA
ncbi:MAG: phasin family protein [Alphaproteobacteria bacterium]|nr:phasin family protein [Alphaproteobacteria bacterium]